MNAQPASVMHGRLADVLLPISRGNPLHLLDMVDRLTLLSLVGALVGVVLGGGVAWFVNERGRQVLVAQAAAQANDQVALGVLSRVTAADFEPPHTPAQLEDLRMRLAPMVSHIRRDGADIVGVQLVARDRTIVYADSPANIGSRLATAEQPLLASALEGQSSSRPGWLSSSPADATIRALYGQVLIVSVPIESVGRRCVRLRAHIQSRPARHPDTEPTAAECA